MITNLFKNMIRVKTKTRIISGVISNTIFAYQQLLSAHWSPHDMCTPLLNINE